MTRSFALATTLVAISLLAGLILVEVFLRIAPETIGVPALAHFPSPLRREIADKLGLPSINEYAVITPEQRTDKGPPLPHPRPDSVFRRVLDEADAKAGAVETIQLDSRGFCNPPKAAERQSVEIVTIGDSFTFCTSVKPDDTATAMLERDTGRPAYDLGIPAIGLREYLQLLRAYGLQLKPKIVVMNVYEGNDLRDADRYEQFVKTGKGRDENQERLERLISHSYAASLIFAGGEWLKKDGPLASSDKVDFTYSGMSQGKRVPMNVTNADGSEPRYAEKYAAGEVSPALWTWPLEDFKRLGAENGFTPIVAYIPSMYTAYDKTVEFKDPAVGKSVKTLSGVQRDWLAKETARLGLKYVDTTPALQAAAESGPLTHFPANVHLTPAGHAIVAAEWRKAIDDAHAGQ